MQEEPIVKESASGDKNTSSGANTSSTLQLKDYVTIFLSIIAVIISTINVYYSQIRVKDNLQARVIDVDMTSKRDTAIIQLAYVNSRNRQAIILSTWYALADTNALDNGAGGSKFDNYEDFPFVMQPHEMKIIDLKLSLTNINLNRGKIIDNIQGKVNYQKFCALHLYALDSKAVNHNELTDFVVQIITDTTEIRSILSGNNKDFSTYKSTVLF